MDNYIVQNIKNDECENCSSIIFINKQTLNKMACFDIDLDEITKSGLKCYEFTKLSIEDKKKIMLDFINNLEKNINGSRIDFIEQNGEKSIELSGELLKFTISSMTMMIEFYVVISYQLIEEFRHIIF